MKFINFSIVKFSFFLSIGILSSRFTVENTALLFFVLLFFAGLLIFVWFIAKKQLFQTIFFGIVTYSCFFLIGYVNYQIRLPNFQQAHYSNKLTNSEVANRDQQTLQLKIKEHLKPDKYQTKYIAEVSAINGSITKGKLLMFLKKYTQNNSLEIDDVLIVSTSIYVIPKPLNPYQFDYSSYMKTKGVYNQIRLTNNDIIQRNKGAKTIRGRSERIREYLLLKLRKSPLTAPEQSIIQALILGQRKDISKQLYSDYAAAGAIHILAVSGLHVGILYFILLNFLKPIKRIYHGIYLYTILIIACLWGYAFITGLSPSVIRAVTMFSFFGFASIINRQTNSINTLFLSYFLLLLINPSWLFYIGFQLSYLAVFFILWLVPIFNKWFSPKNYFIKKLWDIITVTLAAQIGIIPLSLFYFHQFPGLFFLTNIIVLPFLGILLGGGMLIIVLSAFNILPERLALSYNFLIKSLNTFIEWIANQDAFLIQDISFSAEKAVASYILIVGFILIFNRVSFYRILYSLFSIVIFFGVLIMDAYKFSGNQLIVFHKNKMSLFGYKQDNKLLVFKSDSFKVYRDDYPIKKYYIANNITVITEEILPNIIEYESTKIMVLDSLGIYPRASKVDIIILTYSPKINLTRLIDCVQPTCIVADASNYLSYVMRWRNTCIEKKLPFHFTGNKGAYVLNSKK